jgi:hypothetical protein
MTAQEAGQTDPVGAAALHPERHHPAQPERPGDQLAIAVVGRVDRPIVEVAAEPVEGDGDVLVLVGVDADDDVGACERDAGHGC